MRRLACDGARVKIGMWASSDPLRQVSEYRREAEEAERAAHSTSYELERDAYRRIAEGWWDLAQRALLGDRSRA